MEKIWEKNRGEKKQKHIRRKEKKTRSQKKREKLNIRYGSEWASTLSSRNLRYKRKKIIIWGDGNKEKNKEIRDKEKKKNGNEKSFTCKFPSFLLHQNLD